MMTDPPTSSRRFAGRPKEELDRFTEFFDRIHPAPRLKLDVRQIEPALAEVYGLSGEDLGRGHAQVPRIWAKGQEQEPEP